jgi:hypothetical protein
MLGRTPHLQLFFLEMGYLDNFIEEASKLMSKLRCQGVVTRLNLVVISILKGTSLILWKRDPALVATRYLLAVIILLVKIKKVRRVGTLGLHPGREGPEGVERGAARCNE